MRIGLFYPFGPKNLNHLMDEFQLNPPLPLPAGQTEADITALFALVEVEGAPKQELENYWQQDWRRFVYTYGIVSGLSGTCLELGANPYFMTILLKYFTDLKATCANYFGPQVAPRSAQNVSAIDPATGKRETHVMEFHHFNIEEAQFPFPSTSFDVVLFCEVLEHLQSDPVKVIREIKRVLKPSGHLILTTPNVSRLENVCRMVAGENIYDPLSGYGSYGRHNREYNKHELVQLLQYCGFDIDSCFRLTFTKTIRRRSSLLSKSQGSSTSARTISDNIFSRAVVTSGLPGPGDRLGCIAATPPVN